MLATLIQEKMGRETNEKRVVKTTEAKIIIIIMSLLKIEREI